MSPKPDLSPKPWGQPGSHMNEKQIWTQLDCISIHPNKKKSLTLFFKNHHIFFNCLECVCLRKEHQWVITPVGGWEQHDLLFMLTFVLLKQLHAMSVCHFMFTWMLLLVLSLLSQLSFVCTLKCGYPWAQIWDGLSFAVTNIYSTFSSLKRKLLISSDVKIEWSESLMSVPTYSVLFLTITIATAKRGLTLRFSQPPWCSQKKKCVVVWRNWVFHYCDTFLTCSFCSFNHGSLQFYLNFR